MNLTPILLCLAHSQLPIRLVQVSTRTKRTKKNDTEVARYGPQLTLQCRENSFTPKILK